MSIHGIQRRLDALAREVGAIGEAVSAVSRRLDGKEGGRRASSPPSAARVAAAILSVRRARDARFGAELFSDPAWDMLLSLYVSGERAEALSVSQLCEASAVPQTTALRWIETLREAGLIGRETDRRDARRTLIALAPKAREAIAKLLASAGASLFALDQVDGEADMVGGDRQA
jgi:DNA-binding MarR family transcriptional regulator